MKVFPDTNVLLSGFFGSGLCSSLLESFSESEHTILLGEPVAHEFVRIAKEKFKVPPPSLSYALEVFRRWQVAPAVSDRLDGIPDPDDVPIIACALAAGVDIFITGDKALLELKSIGGMDIMSPRDFWERIRAGV